MYIIVRTLAKMLDFKKKIFDLRGLGKIQKLRIQSSAIF